jgi:hypothetical protein
MYLGRVSTDGVQYTAAHNFVHIVACGTCRSLCVVTDVHNIICSCLLIFLGVVSSNFYIPSPDYFFPMARQPYMGLGLLVSSRLHDHTL